MTRGARHCFFSSLRNKRLAACLSRRLWTKTSSTTPSWSTARHSQCFLPPIIRHTSSRCHLSPGLGSRRRIWLAKLWPNLRAHCRTVSWAQLESRHVDLTISKSGPNGHVRDDVAAGHAPSSLLFGMHSLRCCSVRRSSLHGSDCKLLAPKPEHEGPDCDIEHRR